MTTTPQSKEVCLANISPSPDREMLEDSTAPTAQCDKEESSSLITPIPQKVVDLEMVRLVTEDLWTDDVDALQTTLRKLGHLCVKNDETSRLNADSIVQAGGHLAIIKVLQWYPENAGVQLLGCGVLANLAHHSAEWKSLIAGIGGVEVILEAMREHPENADVQRVACGALRNLIYLVKENAFRVIDGGGTLLIVQAMKRFPGKSKLQEHACGALWNMCCWKGGRTAVEEAGGARALADALENFRDDPNVNGRARRALHYLTLTCSC